ncbi:hypothetical protein CYLTODRAFT_426884 [Cylindrobasidium torrendii FP15055 ss-10]|uniref:Uncharacterized protein n=1 Tax=Cylindrobasidium torrendii FP15055 ss-10 TaxID=1314674 RepID=A0A0D7AVQ6_9AGAR|nr:hypothetical protein CYLTODRAFT_426884 [Cylindrobasidium torrendii FP15055 ss-10]
MNRLFPLAWGRIFGPNTRRTLCGEWFRYMQKAIQANGLQDTLDTALDKLDAWEKVHLPGHPREREWISPDLINTTPYTHKNGLVKIPYKEEGSSMVLTVSEEDEDESSESVSSTSST